MEFRCWSWDELPRALNTIGGFGKPAIFAMTLAGVPPKVP